MRDTGVGIPAEELPRLFERFYRIRGQQSRTQEGSGIGLALVQELVKLHGGTISAPSEVGVGTTFVVTLPTGHAHLPSEHLRSEHELRVDGDRSPAVSGGSPALVEVSREAPRAARGWRRPGSRRGRAGSGRRRQRRRENVPDAAAGQRLRRGDVRRRRVGVACHPRQSAGSGDRRRHDAGHGWSGAGARHSQRPTRASRARRAAVGSRGRGGARRGPWRGRRRLPGQAFRGARAAWRAWAPTWRSRRSVSVCWMPSALRAKRPKPRVGEWSCRTAARCRFRRSPLPWRAPPRWRTLARPSCSERCPCSTRRPAGCSCPRTIPTRCPWSRQLATLQPVESLYLRVPRDAELPGAQVVRTSRPLWIESAAAVASQFPYWTSRPTGNKALAALPLIVDDQTIGALIVGFATERTFEPEDRAFLLIMAGQCAAAVHRVQLHAAAESARGQAETALRARDEFLRTLAHDLKTPLTSLLWHVQVLRSSTRTQADENEPDRLQRGSGRAERARADGGHRRAARPGSTPGRRDDVLHSRAGRPAGAGQ